MSKVIDNFLRYVKIDTQSEEKEDGSFPSTEKQRNLAVMLKQELEEMEETLQYY